MKYEQLPPDELWYVLDSKLAALLQILKKKRKTLEKAPQGSLVVSTSHGTIQYYWKKSPEKPAKAPKISTENQEVTADPAVTHSPKCKNGKYLKKENDAALITALAQKEYDLAAVQRLETETKQLKKFLKHTAPSIAQAILRHLNQKKATLITPLTLSDKEYAERWLSEADQTQGFVPVGRSITTLSGLKVRSKSEALIVDALTEIHIPFRYEQVLQLKEYPVHPDFICLNVRTRREYVWEHRGMMDDEEYARKAVDKLVRYQESGWFPGINLIITEETLASQMDADRARAIIQTYLV